MKRRLSARGGITLGAVSLSWPAARLEVDGGQLTLAGMLFGRYRFAPEQVVRFETEDRIPVISRGIRIVHTRADYPERIVFWCSGRPESFMHSIQALGFKPTARSIDTPSRDGMPFRASFLLCAFLMWNGLLLYDGAGRGDWRPGVGFFAAFLLIVLLPWGARRFAGLRTFMLTPGRHLAEVRPLLRLLALAALVMMSVTAFSLWRF